MKRRTRLLTQALSVIENATGLIDRHHGAMSTLIEHRTAVHTLVDTLSAVDYVPTDADDEQLRRLTYYIQQGDWRQR